MAEGSAKPPSCIREQECHLRSFQTLSWVRDWKAIPDVESRRRQRGGQRLTERVWWTTAASHGPSSERTSVSHRHRKSGLTTYPATFAAFERTVGASFVHKIGVRSLLAAAIAALQNSMWLKPHVFATAVENTFFGGFFRYLKKKISISFFIL